MTRDSEELVHAVEEQISAPSTTTNPVRRGPVIVATDGTSATGAPVLAANLIGERLGLPVVVVSVLEPMPTFTSAPDVVVTLDPSDDSRRIRERAMQVTDYVRRFSGGFTPPPVYMRLGDVPTEITRFARESSATLVVVGSSPRSRFRHTTSGELAIRLLHTSPCPVLAVPPTFAALPRSVLVAADFGPSSVRAAQAAMLLVADGGTVTLTHVVPPPVRPDWLKIVPDEDLAIDLHALFDIMREEMGPCVPDGVNVETRIVEGRTEDAIPAAATAFGAEALAIGTHGASLIARTVLGSVADAVIRRAEQPVLVAPPR